MGSLDQPPRKSHGPGRVVGSPFTRLGNGARSESVVLPDDKASFEQIGKYKLLGKIGQGAMGEVYKAHDPVLGRFVAIKTISKGISSEDVARQRF